MSEQDTARPDAGITPVTDLIEEMRSGRMIILVDDEDRENEGDLVIPAQFVTPDTISFMAKEGRGLICLALTRERADTLGLTLQDRRNLADLATAFTVSIEAREGVSTGISARDRTRTIQVAIDPGKGRDDIRTPGHVFPLIAQNGGVLVRAGHTEAAVDLARLAGLIPAAVICEIMGDDGQMMRLPDLVPFARRHGLAIGTIAELIAYRAHYDQIIRRHLETGFRSVVGGDFRLIVYKSMLDQTEHYALVKGDLEGEEPVLVRVHAHHLLNDMLFDTGEGKGGELISALAAIAREGRGALVLIYEHRPYPSERLAARQSDPRAAAELREYGIGAQILRDLGITRFRLLTNSPKHIVALEGFGLSIEGHQPFTVDPAGAVGRGRP